MNVPRGYSEVSPGVFSKINGANKTLVMIDEVAVVPRSVDKALKALRRIRQSREPLMNKLEQRWFDVLKADYPHEEFIPQAVRFRLGNGIWYKPDMFCFNHEWEDEQAISLRWGPCAWEVKGPRAFRGGFENLKVAASLYPHIRWVLVLDDCGWNEQVVIP